jgi:hypothetical protein
VGICYPNLGGVCLNLDGPKWAVPPCFCHKPAKNQQLKLAGKAAEMTKKSAENLLMKIRNFKYKTSSIYIRFWSTLEHKTTQI